MATVEPIKIRGLREWQAALRHAEADLDRQVRLVADEAAEIVVAAARPFIPRRGGAGALAGGLGPDGALVIRRSDLRPARSLFPLPRSVDVQIEAAMARGLDRLTNRAGL